MKRSQFFKSLFVLPVATVVNPKPELTEEELLYLRELKRVITVKKEEKDLSIKHHFKWDLKFVQGEGLSD